MNSPSINPIRLLQDSQILLAPKYKSVLLIFIPYAIYILTLLFIPNNLTILVLFLYSISFQTICSFSAIFYLYQHLIQRNTTVNNSINFVIGKYLQIILCSILTFLIILPASLLLIIPGIYVGNRLSLAPYAIVIENCSAADGIRRSWQLVRGKWWSVFWASLISIMLIWIPIILISFSTAKAFGVSFWQVFLGIPPSSEANYVNANLVTTVVSGAYVLVSLPLVTTYQLFLFVNLKALKSREEMRLSVLSE